MLVVRWSSSENRAQLRILEKIETELGFLSQKLSRRWGLPKSILDVGLRLNPRLTRSVARYRRENGVIELGPRFLRLRARRKEVLCHELAHVAVEYLYGKQSQPHGSEWRKLMESAGFVPAVRLSATPQSLTKKAVGANADAPITSWGGRQTMLRYVYEHRCPVCQMTQRAKRPVSRWRCAECVAAGLAGDLEITRITQR